MDPKQVLEMTAFIEGDDDSTNIIVENKSAASVTANALLESRKLYDLLKKSGVSLDEVVDQISVKNKAALAYAKATGKKWLF